MIWRIGTENPLDVYEADRSVCQCHTADDAARIVAALNAPQNWVRCAICRGTGRLEAGYCGCKLGRDLQRIDARQLNPVGGTDE